MREKKINKLLELLKRYDPQEYNPGWELNGDWLSYNQQSKYNSELILISNKYGFIQRLCDNDMIDWWVVGGFEPEESLFLIGKDKIDSEMFTIKRHISKAGALIMVLSICSNPISDLCAYLK